MRIDRDVRDHLAVAQAEVGPRLAGIGGFVHAVTRSQIWADDAGARADIDDVGIRGRHGDRADRAGRLVVEQRQPVGAVVGRAPHAAIVEAGVEHVGLAGHAVQRPGATATGRANAAPVHLAVGAGRRSVGVGSRRLCVCRGRQRDQAKCGRGQADGGGDEQSWDRHVGIPLVGVGAGAEDTGASLTGTHSRGVSLQRSASVGMMAWPAGRPLESRWS
jgi:hypothetical protein